MTFQQLRYLVEISKHNSISKAAASLFVTQPSISKAIHDLEEEFSITILNRTNKGVVFTKDGAEFLAYAKILLEQTEMIHHHFNKNQIKQTKKLSISSQHYGFAIEAAARLIDNFADQQFELAIREGKSLEVIEEVYSGKSVIGIISLSNLNAHHFERHFTSKNLVFTSLATVKQHVFLRKEHPLAHCKTLTIEQLKTHPYLSYQQEDTLLHFAEERLHVDDIKQLIYVTDRGTMNNLLANTNGYNIGTGCIVPGYMNPNIISIPLHEEQLLQIGFIRRHDAPLTEELLVYLDFMKKALKSSLP